MADRARTRAASTRTGSLADLGVAGIDTGARTPQPRRVTHLTPAERAERGVAARADAPLAAHGEWQPSTTRPSPVDVLEQQAVTRVPSLVPIRYGRMLASPFAFYRGAAAVMAGDLATEPHTGLKAQLCGDAHLSNFGAFASAERRLIFSLNDFDETLPGPFEWDLKRLVASFEIAGRELGLGDKERRRVGVAVAQQYRESMQGFAAMRDIEVWYTRLDIEEALARFAPVARAKQRKRMEKTIAKARTKDSMKALSKLTQIVDGEPRIVGDPPLVVPIGDLFDDAFRAELEALLHGIYRSYRRSLPRDRRRLLERYRLVDVARKVVGVGSVGTRTWIALLLGRDSSDPLFLQFKEAQPSVLEPYLGRGEFANAGQRVVEGQRLMQASSDILLGWDRITGVDGVKRDYYVRQLWDWKASADVEGMDARALAVYAQMCGWTLARAHARSGDAIAIAAYLGDSAEMDEAMARFAVAYADQNERDHEALQRAVDAERVVAETGI
jgi:uncharacterized protein (DUF2252 family)